MELSNAANGYWHILAMNPVAIQIDRNGSGGIVYPQMLPLVQGRSADIDRRITASEPEVIDGDEQPAVVLADFEVVAYPRQAGQGAHSVGEGANDRPRVGTPEPHFGGKITWVLEGGLGREVQQDIVVVTVDGEAQVLPEGTARSQG